MEFTQKIKTVQFFLVIAFLPTKTGKNAGELAKMSTIFCLYCVCCSLQYTQSGRPMHTTLGLYCIVLLGIRITYMDCFQLKGSSNDSYYLLGKGVNLFVSSVWFGHQKENQPNYQRLTVLVCSRSYLHVFLWETVFKVLI